MTNHSDPWLTAEQNDAATSTHAGLLISAGAGAGKTRVAASRYGHLRMVQHRGDARGIVAVSFTRKATSELRSRIVRQWGGNAIAWPNRATTMDGLFRSTVAFLLRTGVFGWPGGGVPELEVFDHWQKRPGATRITPDKTRQMLALDGDQLVLKAVKGTRDRAGFEHAADYLAHLSQGHCTHDEIRLIVELALRTHSHQVEEYLRSSIAHLLVDEAFDLNPLDLRFIAAVRRAGINVTMIGDRWQAIYSFRKADPRDIDTFVKRGSFEVVELTSVHRFKTDEMAQLNSALRRSDPVSIGTSGPTRRADIVLGAEWKGLWAVGDSVLPVAFTSQTYSETDAALTLLLGEIVADWYEIEPYGTKEAHAILGIKPNRPVLQAILAGIRDDTFTAASALHELRSAHRTGTRRLAQTVGRPARIGRMQSLADRLRRPERPVRGLTIHQAKGLEWDHVDLVVNEDVLDSLGRGLNPGFASDRGTFVGLTRARSTVRIRPVAGRAYAPAGQIQIDYDDDLDA